MTFEKLWEEYLAAKAAHNELCEMQGPDPDESNLTIAEEIVKLRQEREGRKHHYERLMQLVLGHPFSFENVRCWMVDAKGRQAEVTELTPKIVAAVNEDAEHELGHKYIEMFGALPTEVRSVMANWNLTDSGGGGGCWHLGCLCTEAEARDLCVTLHTRFRHAIDQGLLAIERKPWSLQLIDTTA